MGCHREKITPGYSHHIEGILARVLLPYGTNHNAQFVCLNEVHKGTALLSRHGLQTGLLHNAEGGGSGAKEKKRDPSPGEFGES